MDGQGYGKALSQGIKQLAIVMLIFGAVVGLAVAGLIYLMR